MKISRRIFLKRALATGGALYSGKALAQKESGAWPILNQWNFSEFEKYSKWVNNIYQFKRNGSYKQKGAKLGYILNDDEMNLLNNPAFLEKGNVQAKKEELETLTSVTHCGSFPELLVLYYSYRRGLPAIVSKIEMEKGGDIRYSYGNHPVGHVNSLDFSGNFKQFILSSIEGGDKSYNFVTGNYRTDPTLEGTDSVPITLDRQFLRPGTMCYNANGHCLVVGDIEESGEVHFLDAHPDQSITYNQTLSAIPSVNSAKLGVKGFKYCYDGFRNPRLVKIKNGNARQMTNEEMLEFGYSVEQYKKMTELKENNLTIRGEKPTSYPDIVRMSLRTGIENPIKFLENSCQELAEMFQERATFVENGWNDVLKNGAITLPDESSKENIYQANGRWETWSSPSSDVDRKNKYNYITKRLESMIEGFGVSPAYDYKNFNSKQEMISKIIELKQKLFEEKKITYLKSDEKEVVLSLKDIEQRLFDLSFDPNHDPALRWGANNPDEKSNMKLISTPLNSGGALDALTSYSLERGLRYYPVRQTTPTSLSVEKNPSQPPFGTLDDTLKKYVK
ncbi:MAG: hypothetical protein WC781_01665 [Candidatus Pacearchaeota archaeon]|jgi:hypothetical protein